jgi:O-acetyl-ADP-ribose deacetylase (regulator of RNase III)
MIEIMHADITTLDVDAIVNAANGSLLGGGGVDGAIHRAAGPALVRASAPLAPLETGGAVVTPGFRLPARYVVHVVGPVWTGGDRGEPELLERTYRNGFTAALRQGDIGSIAWPAVSTGVYRFPKERAAAIALRVMREYEPEFERVIACVFDPATAELYDRTLAALRARDR